MSPQIGAPAPDFALRDQHGQTVRLADFAGSENVGLVFYPFAFSGICTGELCELRDNIEAFAERRRPARRRLVRPGARAARLGRGREVRVPAAVRLLAARGGRAGVRGVQRRRSGSRSAARSSSTPPGVAALERRERSGGGAAAVRRTVRRSACAVAMPPSVAGPVAQLVEHRAYTAGVVGSNPAGPTELLRPPAIGRSGCTGRH